MLDDPATNRAAAVKRLVESAGGKLVSMYSFAAEGPGVMVIFDVPEPNSAAAIGGIAVAGGAIQNVKPTRLMTQDEVAGVRKISTRDSRLLQGTRTLSTG